MGESTLHEIIKRRDAEISRLQSALDKANEALRNIQIFTERGKDKFQTLVTACGKTGDLDLIEWAADCDALSSLIFKTAERGLTPPTEVKT